MGMDRVCIQKVSEIFREVICSLKDDTSRILSSEIQRLPSRPPQTGQVKNDKNDVILTNLWPVLHQVVSTGLATEPDASDSPEHKAPAHASRFDSQVSLDERFSTLDLALRVWTACVENPKPVSDLDDSFEDDLKSPDRDSSD